MLFRSGMSTPGSASADRRCAPCELGSTYSGANSGAACLVATVCVDGEYEKLAPTLSINRKCLTHSSKCPDGQYTSAPPSATADRTCDTITVCAPGLYEITPPGASSDRKCDNCAAGYWKKDTGSQACTAWRTCPAGQGKIAEGTKIADRQCDQSDLDTTFSATNGADACKALRDDCGAGEYMNNAPTVSSDRTCTSCGPSQFKATKGNEACADWQLCAVGYGMSAGGSTMKDRTCTACEAGKTYSAEKSADGCKLVRTPCAAGSYTKSAATASADLTCD